MYRIVKRIVRTVTTVTLLVRWEKDSLGQDGLEMPITLPANVSITEEEITDQTDKANKDKNSESISNTNKGEKS